MMMQMTGKIIRTLIPRARRTLIRVGVGRERDRAKIEARRIRIAFMIIQGKKQMWAELSQKDGKKLQNH